MIASHTPVMRYILILVVLAMLAFPIAAATNNAHGSGLSLPLVPSLTPAGSLHPLIGWTSLTGSKPLLSLSGTQGIQTGGNGADPFAVIDEKLAPAEAGALKSVIQNTLHAFSYDAATGAWNARNYAGQILFTYTKDGTAEFSDGENTFGLSLLGVGRGGDLVPAGSGVVQADGRQLNIARAGYTEWYKNNDEGVEQGVTIASRPAGSGPLQVGFGLTSEGSFSLKDGQTLTITDTSGTPLFTYTGLVALSTDGRRLPASLAAEGTTLYWVVDDADATYPITIDPVVVSASRATATFTGGANYDYFGTSVSLSSNGSRALVGAPGNYTAIGQTGAAYIFNMPAGGWSGITPTPASSATATFTGGAAGDYFGTSVSLSSNGSRALVGAPGNCTGGMSQTGAAYIFQAPWSETTSASAATATFTGGAASDQFGTSVSLSSNGSRALVGAPGNYTAIGQTGAAYIFNMPAGGWSGITPTPASSATATFTGGANSDQFGNSVSLSSDGSRALVGAFNNDTGVTGVTRAGAAYIFQGPWSGITPTPASSATATFTGAANSDQFGISVSLSDGSRALVGAPRNDTAIGQTGAAYIFQGPWSGTTSASSATATFTGGANNDRFGISVSLSSDGSRALVGAYGNDTGGSDAGAAYIFQGPWSRTTYASSANATFTGGAGGDQFGNSVALSSDGSTALVGAKYNDTGGKTDAGAAYIFQPPYVTLTAGGNTTGQVGSVVDGLTLNSTGTLTNVDLYLGTSPTTLGPLVKTGIPSLPASTATPVDDVDLTSATAGTYYLIVTEAGTTTVLGATSFAVYTVTNPGGGGGGGGGGDGPGPGDSGISGISPGSGTSGTQIQTTITGSNFPTTTKKNGAGTTTIKVWLSQLGEGSIIGKEVNVLSSTKLTCTFNLAGAHPGKWTVNAKRSDGFLTAVLTDAFTVKSAPAVPVVHHINPSTVKAGAKAFILTVTGEHFAKGNRVKWKGVARETTFVSSITIKAKVLATDIAKSGRYVVSVYRPGRDAATSNGVALNVRK